MSDTVLTTLIQTLPGILWVAFAVIVFLVLRQPLIQQVSRLRALDTPFGSLDFTDTLELVGRAAESRPDDPSSPAERHAVATRLEFAAPFLEGGRILWVDDEPQNNRVLVDLFERVGMAVDAVPSTSTALAELDRAPFDLIITDMARGGDATAGLQLVERWGSQLPVILYAFQFDPWQGVPPELFAYTTSYDDLIHLVIDVMERLRFGAAPERSGRQVVPRLAERRGPARRTATRSW